MPLIVAFAMSPVQVTDFGAQPGSLADATDAVRQAIAQVKRQGAERLVFAPGDYHFYAIKANRRDLFLSNSDVSNPRQVAMVFESLRNLRVDGKGVRLLFHGRVIPFLVDRCANVRFTGFEIDWPRPLMSQADVLESDARGVTLAIDAVEYPYSVRDGRLTFLVEGEERPVWSWMEFDPATRGVAYRTGDAGCMDGDWQRAKATELRPGVVRLEFANTLRPAVGHVLVARHGQRDHAGAFFQECKDVTLEDVSFRHTSGLGVLAQRCENLTYRRVEVAPAPGSKRLFAGHDDGFHFSNCKGRILVDECRFEGLMDDPINIHGTSVRAIEPVGARTWRARFMHPQSVGFPFGNVGDEVSFIDHRTLLSRGRAHIVGIESESITDFRVQFDRDVPSGFVAGDALENLTWTPSATIRRSTFGGVRARGLLVTTPRKVIIEDNVFRSSGAAILVAGDANGWYESGAVTDVTIRRNRFENCLTSPYQFCEALISVCPEIPTEGAAPFHRGISILDNTFVTFDRPVLWAKSVDGLRFEGNRIDRSRSYKPWHGNQAGVTLIDCVHATVTGNTLGEGYEGRSTAIVRGDPATITVTGWK